MSRDCSSSIQPSRESVVGDAIGRESLVLDIKGLVKLLDRSGDWRNEPPIFWSDQGNISSYRMLSFKINMIQRLLACGGRKELLGTVHRLERVLQIAEQEGIEVRREWLRGIRGGLVRLGKMPVLFVDEGLPISEQWELTSRELGRLDWTGTEFGQEMERMLHGES